MNQILHYPDIIIIAVFLTATLVLGLRFAGKKQSTQSYFLAKGKVPAWAIGMSLLSTLISSVTFLAYPGEGYSSNWILLVQGLMVPVVLLVMIWFVVPLYRKVIGLSTYEYFEKRFGSFARYYSSLAFILRQFSAMGTIFFLLALALSKMIGVNTMMMITAIGVIIVLINLLGGMEAVIWLDVFQGFLLFASGIVCLTILVFSAAHSPAEVWQIAKTNGRTGFGPYAFDFTRLTFAVMAINGVFYAIQKYGTDQTVVQRYLTAQTDKAAIRATLLGSLLTVPVWIMFMFIGTALFVFYRQHPLGASLRADAVFPYFIMTRLPVGVVGFIISAMISAAICSMSADLNSLAAVGVEDYYKRIKRGRTDKQYLRAGKGIIIFSGVLSVLIAMLYVRAGSEGVLGIVFTLYAIFSGGIAGIFMLGLFSARANRQGVNIGIIACILFTAYAFLTSTRIGVGDNKTLLLDLGSLNFVQHKLMLGVYSHIVVLVVGYLASLFFPKPALDSNLLYSGWRAALREQRSANPSPASTLSPRKALPMLCLCLIGAVASAQTTDTAIHYAYRRSVEEGNAALDKLAARYNNKAQWEARRQELRPCLYAALDLSPLPARPASSPIVTGRRVMDGYTVENIAIQYLPGVYVCGSLYRPAGVHGKIPVILNPDGHFEHQRYRPDCQIRCAALARMGAMAFSYDLFAWGESLLQFKLEDHRTGLAMSLQMLAGIRILDYLLSSKDADNTRVAITGGSGGGSQTVLLTALDERIKVSVPVVSLSSSFDGGCPCESGMPIHTCGGGNDNVELAAMAAPHPQLVISDGKDWTAHFPEHDLAYLQRVYGFYGKGKNIQSVHLKDEGHDYGLSKRKAMYAFMAKHLGLNLSAIRDKNGNIDESKCTVEDEPALYVFGAHGERLPANAIKGFANLQKVFAEARKDASLREPPQSQPPASTQTASPSVQTDPVSVQNGSVSVQNGSIPSRYHIGVVDLMLLKRQKLGAFPLASRVGADGVEVDMGGLGPRETFDSHLAVDSVRQQFLDTARELHLDICSLAMTGFYAQSFAARPTYRRMIGDCIQTMKQMGVKVAFLPLGVQSDLRKNPELRPAVVERLKVAGKMAQDAGVVIGIETSLSAAEEVQLLRDIGSPGIQIYFNFANAIEGKRNLNEELRTLGKDRICQIHCTDSDGVWLQNDPAIDMPKVKRTLDQMGWSGWLVIERSRDAKQPHNVKANFTANTAYMRSIFEPQSPPSEPSPSSGPSAPSASHRSPASGPSPPSEESLSSAASPSPASSPRATPSEESLFSAPSPSPASSPHAAPSSAQIWVSPTGSDGNPGTYELPKATPASALREAREWRRLCDPRVTNGVQIILRGGQYFLTEPLFIRPEDSGTPDAPTVIAAAPGEEPVLSGGVAIRNWKKLTDRVPGLPQKAAGKVWVADAPRWEGRTLRFRQLWVNGIKAIRARDANTDDDMSRILSVDTQSHEIWVPASGYLAKLASGDDNTPARTAGTDPIEMVIHQMWAIAVLRIKNYERIDDKVRLRFYEPESRIEFEHPWPAAVINKDHKKNGNSAFYLVNALELLDMPGEWYEDAGSGKVYYWPRTGEDLATSEVVAPALETLLNIEGVPDRQVTHVQCQGITFAYSTWMRPSESGHVPLQAGMFLLDAYKLRVPGTPDKKSLENQAWIGRPPAVVSVAYAHHVLFGRCRFLHLASSGLDLARGSSEDHIDQCLFKDIGGTGIQVGIYSDPAFETHLPYDPSDKRAVCADDTVSNNLVTDCANEDWGCLGISAGYVRGIRIEHNEVSEVSYSGIGVGWGWTRTQNCMRENTIYANHVHHYARHMYDVGGIYTLSAQPGTLISENCVDSIYHPPYVHDPDHWFYFYFDEGSSYITIRDNWCPGSKFMKNANGPGNTWENNGPMVSERIKRAAGLLSSRPSGKVKL